MKQCYQYAIIGLTMMIGTTTALFGQDVYSNTNYDSSWNTPPFYHAQEVSLDVYGMGTVGQYTLDHFTGERFVHHLRLGLGAGGNYFFTRYFGVGAEAWSESTHHSFVNDVAGDLIVRIPIDDTGLAPYGFLGGGREFEPFIQWEGHIGAGLEFRFAKHMGIFVDGRYVFAENSPNFGLGRAGFRISF